MACLCVTVLCFYTKRCRQMQEVTQFRYQYFINQQSTCVTIIGGITFCCHQAIWRAYELPLFVLQFFLINRCARAILGVANWAMLWRDVSCSDGFIVPSRYARVCAEKHAENVGTQFTVVSVNVKLSNFLNNGKNCMQFLL